MEIWYLLITEKFLFWSFREWEIRSFLSQKVAGSFLIFPDIYWLQRSSCFNLFGHGKHGIFLSQKGDGKMIFTGYWKLLVLIFSGMGNTVFFGPKIWWKDDITGCWEVLVLNFLVMGNTAFFSTKKLMERQYLLGLFELSMIFQDLGNMAFHAVYQRLN